jgi:hypothetical protein
MYKAIEGLLILHNMCIDFGDKPEDIWDYSAMDADDFDNDNISEDVDLDDKEGIPARETNAWLLNQGHQKQMIIFNELVPID